MAPGTMRTPILASLAALALAGCVADTDSAEQRANHHDDVEDDIDLDECKIEGARIGVVGEFVTVGSTIINFEGWEPKPDSPGEVLGFTVSTNAHYDLHFKVKAGTEVYEGTGTSWTHPGGPGANAISHIDFCEQPDCDPWDPDGDGEPEGPDEDDGPAPEVD